MGTTERPRMTAEHSGPRHTSTGCSALEHLTKKRVCFSSQSGDRHTGEKRFLCPPAHSPWLASVGFWQVLLCSSGLLVFKASLAPFGLLLPSSCLGCDKGSTSCRTQARKMDKMAVQRLVLHLFWLNAKPSLPGDVPSSKGEMKGRRAAFLSSGDCQVEAHLVHRTRDPDWALH